MLPAGPGPAGRGSVSSSSAPAAPTYWASPPPNRTASAVSPASMGRAGVGPAPGQLPVAVRLRGRPRARQGRSDPLPLSQAEGSGQLPLPCRDRREAGKWPLLAIWFKRSDGEYGAIQLNAFWRPPRGRSTWISRSTTPGSAPSALQFRSVRLWSVEPRVPADNRGPSRTLIEQLRDCFASSPDRPSVVYNDEVSLPASLWSARRSLPGSAHPSTRGPTPLLARPVHPCCARPADPTTAAPLPPFT